jgi:2-polyprenyl-6-methoxyphenol hydroxylase-like FAD-dependent oxidoreductase
MPGEIIGELHYSLLGELTDKPFRMHFEQARLSFLLLERLREQPSARIHFEHEVVAVDIQSDEVRIDLQTPSGPRSVRADFLVGCDGARSRVREAIGVSFEGRQYSGMALRLRTDRSIEALLPGLAPLTYLVDDPNSASFLRMPDCWRVILRVPPDVSEEQCSDPSWYDSRLAPLIPGYQGLPGVLGTDCYRAGRFMASAMLRGRVLLAGDSAHITNTRGGMNMNCGIHDAWELGRALVQALEPGSASGARSISSSSLKAIETVASARHQIIRDKLLPRTDTMVSKQGDWLAHVREMLADEGSARRYLSQAAMLDMVDIE